MGDASRLIVVIAGSLAGLVHVGFWVLEAVLWDRPAVHRIFGVTTREGAAAQRGAFYNIGWYNLLLALGAWVGVGLYAVHRGAALLVFAMAFMVAAALVLLRTARAMWRGALIQGLPAAVALAALAVSPGAIAGPPLQPVAAPGAIPRITASAPPGTEAPQAPAVIGGVTAISVASRADVATHLEVPWGLAFAPDGSLLVTERERGRILRIADGAVTALTGPGADALAAFARNRGEGGLLGIAVLDRGSGQPPAVYVYQTRDTDNAVLRMDLGGDELSAPVEVLTGIPKAANHNGGRLKLGPDGHLYVTTGDASSPDLAQDPASLAGKILRIVADGTAADGSPAPSNPFGTVVYSWGHRNVQGIAWTDDGRLYASEFGQGDVDELNLIVAGANYGWPLVEGLNRAPAGTGLGDTVDGLTYPVVEWRPTSSASPSGIAATPAGVFVAGLRGQTLFWVPLTASGVGSPVPLVTDLGRVRDVIVGPDGALYVATSNTDGRGTPRAGDDRIVRIEIAAS